MDHLLKSQRLLVPGLCAAFILIGLVMMLSGWDQIQRARASSLWPTASGLIVGADVYPVRTSNGLRWRPVITYRYVATGREVTGTRISLQESATAYSEAAARRYVERYRLQTPVKVYYNPDSVSEAVLEQSVPRAAYLSLGLGVLFALPGSGLVLILGMAFGRRRGWLIRKPSAPGDRAIAEMSDAELAAFLAEHDRAATETKAAAQAARPEGALA